MKSKTITNLSYQIILFIYGSFLILSQDLNHNQQIIKLIDDPVSESLSIFIGDKLFTKYIYHDAYYKPILHPIYAVNQVDITRGYPINPRPGERIDHPHQVGNWLSYGNVNGIDFWNNSDAITDKSTYGSIEHLELEIDQEKGHLETKSRWVDNSGTVLLYEKSIYKFKQVGNARIIDRTTTLKATKLLSLEDNKEGFFGIRVRRELEHPSDTPLLFVDANGHESTVPVLNNSGVSGNYFSSEGVRGIDVWGKRAKWVSLSGIVDDQTVSITIFDHPENTGYPTYWHARGYGLFSANPLGQAIFSEGLDKLNITLDKDSEITFKFRVLIHNGKRLTPEQISSFALF